MIKYLAFLFQKTAHLSQDVLEKTWWAVFFTPVLIFIEKYIFSDWGFLPYLLVLIVMDTLLGFGYAWRMKEISGQKFAGLFVKIIVYGPLMILGHVIENFEVSGVKMEGGFYFKFVIYLGIMIVEAISILKNLGKINKNLVPKFLLKRMEGFNESGDFNELTKGNDKADSNQG